MGSVPSALAAWLRPYCARCCSGSQSQPSSLPDVPRVAEPLGGHSGASLADDQVQRWRQDGWLLLDDVLSSQCSDLARFVQSAQSEERRSFPHVSETLNKLPLHPQLLRIAGELLGVEDLRLVTAKMHSPKPRLWQSLEHCCIVPEREAPDAVWLVLSCTEADSSMRVASTSEEHHAGGTPILHRAGSGLLLRMGAQIWFDRPAAAAHRMYYVVLRKADAEWVQGDTFVRSLGHVGSNLIRDCSPAQRSALGFPAVGSPLWKSERNRALWSERWGFDSGPYSQDSLADPPLPQRQALPDRPDNTSSSDLRRTFAEPGRLESPVPAAGLLETEPLSPEQIEQWHEQGWLHTSNLWPADLIEAAAQQRDNREFPCDIPAINDIVLHPRLLCAVAQLLRVPVSSVRLMQAMMQMKSSDTDDWPQSMHQDYHNNSLLTPSRCFERWSSPEDVAMILYLDDHDDVGGGTCFVPGLRHTESLHGLYGLVPDYAKYLDNPDALTRRFARAQSLCALERRARYRPGSALIYTIGTWHRGTPVNPGKSRCVMFLSFRAASATWCGGSPAVGEPTAEAFAKLDATSNDFDMKRFFVHLTPDQRSLLGFPSVGNNYWSPETREAVRKHYGDDLDLGPYS